MDPAIRVNGFCRYYETHEQEPGFLGSLSSFFRRKKRLIKAVDGASFQVSHGDIVALLGPNGAGKTTTLKTLAGVLHPTSGQVAVLGHAPYRRSREFLRSISFVMGQKSELIWDLPPSETFLLHKALYDLPDKQFNETRDELVDLFDLRPLIGKPVRTLSLGERMRCELAVALVHRPQVLFLDEPTLGLDALAQAALRRYIRDYRERFGATVLVSSHNMEDVLALCERIIVINHGRIMHDGRLDHLLPSLVPTKRLRIMLQEPHDAEQLSSLGSIESAQGLRIILRVPRSRIKEVSATLLHQVGVRDLSVEEPAVEEVVSALFRGGAHDDIA